MSENLPFISILVLGLVGALVLYARNLEQRKKKYTYRELSPAEIIEKNATKNAGKNIYGKRSSGHLDIDKFVNRHAR